MIVRALDANGDWTFGSGKQNYISDLQAFEQLLATRVRSWVGDCFFDQQAGVDWTNQLNQKNQQTLILQITAVIMNTPGYSSMATGVSASLDPRTRLLSVTYGVISVYGPTAGTINLPTPGVTPVPIPPGPLFPVQTFPILNNSTAIIPGAAFNPVAFSCVNMEYFIERRDGTPSSFTQVGTLILTYNIGTGLWSIDNAVLTGASGPVSGVAFTINSSTGQVSYTSDNMTGSNYVGNLIIKSTTTFMAVP